MIGVYIRCSSGKQTVKSQEPDLRQWANGKDGVIWYVDEGVSGKTMDRKHFNRLLADVRLGKIKTVCVWRLDRLGRTASGLAALFDEFIALGVNLVSLKDGIDLGTPAGKLMANIIASIAEYETEIRGERIRAGLNAKREAVAAGLDTWNAGRPKGTPNKATPDVCEAVKEQVAKGINKSKVAKMFHLSRPTIYAILKGEAA